MYLVCDEISHDAKGMNGVLSFSSQPSTRHLSSLNTRHCDPVIYFCQVCVHGGIPEDYKNVVPPKEKATALSPLKTERY